jgi:transmembrane sensor
MSGMGFLPKSRARIRREASQWVVRLAEHASEEDRAAFERWRDADPRHAEAYDRIASIWNQSAQLSPSRAVDEMRQDPLSERSWAIGFALAASLAVVTLVSILLLSPRWLPDSAPHAREEMLFAAALGEIKEVDLPDRSRLTLDSGSRVEAVFTETERSLTLREGRARFQVAHEVRPFVVHAGTSEVLATGTLFDVSLIGGRTAVLLLEGSVEVRAVNEEESVRPSQHLEPGQKLILSKSAPAVRQRATRDDTAWPTRMLEFDGTRLEDAAALANRYHKVQLKLGTERIRGLRVSGAFRAGDAAGFARSLAAAFDLRLVRQPGGSLLLVDPDPDDRAPAPPR